MVFSIPWEGKGNPRPLGLERLPGEWLRGQSRRLQASFPSSFSLPLSLPHFFLFLEIILNICPNWSYGFNNYFLFYMPVTVPSAEDMPLRRKLKEINKKQKTSALTEFIFWRVAKEILMVAIRLVRTYTETNLTSIEITNTRTLQSSNFAFNKISLHIYFYRCKMLFMKLIIASLSSVNRRLVIYS